MLKKFINMTTYRKLVIISFLLLVLGSCWGAINAYKMYDLMVKMTNEKNEDLVGSFVTTLDNIAKDVDKGLLTLDEGKILAKDIVRNARYQDGKQYFWINDFDGEVVMHPIIPTLERMSLKQEKPELHKLFSDFAKAAKANKKGDIYYYKWPKPGEDPDKKFPKASFVKSMSEWGWVVGTGVYIDDLEARALRAFYFEMFYVVIFGCCLLAGIYFVNWMLSIPLSNLSAGMRSLSDGNLDVEVGYTDRDDEVGMIAKAFAVFKDNAVAKQKMEEEQKLAEQRSQEEKVKLMQDLAHSFEEKVGASMTKLTEMASQLDEMSGILKLSSNDNLESSERVSQAAQSASMNVQTVASATEELSSSSSEISRQIDDVAQKSQRTSTEAAQGNEKVNELNVLADSIGAVVFAIKDIAEQTNLLALNATIEAARAGEAGKGFAVVADEVKKLAMETAQKTEEIDSQVAQIQSAIHGAVTVMTNIMKNVADIDGATTTVASAVQEQNAATTEISRNISTASEGTQEVSDNISSIKQQAIESQTVIENMEKSVENITDISASLNKEVQEFLSSLRNG